MMSEGLAGLRLPGAAGPAVAPPLPLGNTMGWVVAAPTLDRATAGLNPPGALGAPGGGGADAGAPVDVDGTEGAPLEASPPPSGCFFLPKRLLNKLMRLSRSQVLCSPPDGALFDRRCNKYSRFIVEEL
jgi:hypothetical protein